MFSHLLVGDTDKKEKVALFVLCKVLTKKGIEDGLLYIFEECNVYFNY